MLLPVQVNTAFKEVFSKKIYFLYFFLGSLSFMLIYIILPIKLNPSNSLQQFILITPLWAAGLLVMLSVLTGILLSMQIYILKNKQGLQKKEWGTGAGALASSIFSGLFSTVTCASCLSALFSFLTPASMILLSEYRWHITAISIVIVILSIFLTSKRIADGCTSCHIKDSEL